MNGRTRGVCCECGKKRDYYKAVVKLRDGTILRICRRCWIALDYESFMGGPSSPK